ncbi:YceD family protein [Bizionia sediminis]|uniref:YceD family protein n=1 Tax=Bizionia sediminis TaxID=1737064 RepID=A0ABW5KSQ8_9FLAO
MRELKTFTIPFVGLKLGKHQFEYKIDKAFFDFFDYQDFETVDVLVNLELNKKTTLLELHFQISGHVGVSCDVTNEPYNQPLENTFDLVVKFGEAYNDEEIDLLVIPHGEYEINVQQYIYETIILAVPTKLTHPGLEDGTLQSEILDKLEELSPKENKEKKDNEEIDPRWNTLKKLLTDK